MRLPNPERTQIDPAKLAGYCLNPEHRDGRHKARVFASALGLTAQDAPVLRKALLLATLTGDAVLKKETPHAPLYQVDFVMDHHGRSAAIRSAWIVRADEGFPRLVSCYVLI